MPSAAGQRRGVGPSSGCVRAACRSCGGRAQGLAHPCSTRGRPAGFRLGLPWGRGERRGAEHGSCAGAATVAHSRVHLRTCTASPSTRGWQSCGRQGNEFSRTDFVLSWFSLGTPSPSTFRACGVGPWDPFPAAIPCQLQPWLPPGQPWIICSVEAAATACPSRLFSVPGGGFLQHRHGDRAAGSRNKVPV